MRIAVAFACLVLAASAVATPENTSRFYEDAQKRFDKGELEAAIIQLKNAIQQDRTLLAAHLLLGRAMLRAGQLKGAETAFEEALKLGVSRDEVAVSLAQIHLLKGEPKLLLERVQPTGLPISIQVEVLTLRGTAYAETGNMTMAARSFAEARSLDAKSATPLIGEISTLIRADKLEQARTLAAKAIELAPKNALAWSAHATVLHALRDPKGALDSYNRAIAIESLLAETRVARASVLLDLKREADAAKDLQFLKDNDLDDPRAAYLRAELLARKGNPSGAKAELKQAARLVDALPREWLAGREHLMMVGALAHYALRNWKEASDYLEGIIRSSSRNLVARKLLASIYVETRAYDKAQPALESLVKEVPKDAQLLFMLGSVHLAQRRYAQAAALLESAVASGSETAARNLGIVQMALGRDAEGLANLEKAYAADPSDARAATELAMTYVRVGQKQKAILICEAIIKRDPANLAMLNFVGTIKNVAGDPKGARVAFAGVLAKDASFRPAVLNLARLDVAESRHDDARLRLTQLLARRSNDADVLFELGQVERAAGRPEEAMRHWQKADDLQRVDPRPGLALVDLLVARGQARKAVEFARSLAPNYPENLPVQLALGRAFLAAGNRADARQLFQAATRMAGFDPDLQLQIGRLQLSAGNAEGAVYSTQKALQARPDDAVALVIQVEAETLRGDRARADAALKTLNAKHPGSTLAILTSANLAMARAQYPAAAAGYRAVAAREPTPAVAINVAQAHIAAGEPAKAAAYLDQWLKTRPQDQAIRKALAEAQAAAGDDAAARKTYAAILAAEPNDPLTLNNYAMVLLRLGDPAQAGVHAAKAFSIMPAVAEIGDTLGWTLVQQGKAEQSLRYLREARLRSPTNGEIRFHLAYALAKLGRTAEAREELATAMSSTGKVQSRDEMAKLKVQLGL